MREVQEKMLPQQGCIVINFVCVCVYNNFGKDRSIHLATMHSHKGSLCTPCGIKESSQQNIHIQQCYYCTDQQPRILSASKSPSVMSSMNDIVKGKCSQFRLVSITVELQYYVVCLHSNQACNSCYGVEKLQVLKSIRVHLVLRFWILVFQV